MDDVPCHMPSIIMAHTFILGQCVRSAIMLASFGMGNARTQ
jgi:hypothetical protein